MTDFDDLLGDQPDVPDWPGLVRGTVRRTRLKRRAIAGFTLVALVVIGGGSIVLASAGTSHPHRDVVSLATDSPTPTVEPTATATDATDATTAQPTPTPTATASTSDAPTTDPTPSEEPTATPTPTYYAPREQTITIDAVDAPTTVMAGQTYTVKVRASWSGSKPNLRATCDCDDQPTYTLPLCPAPFIQPPGPKPEPGSSDFTTELSTKDVGVHTVTVNLTLSCGYFIGQASKDISVTVLPDPRTTPTPTATPTTTTAPDPTPTATTSP